MATAIDGADQNSKWPVLSLKERDRRWRWVREMMREEGADCLLIFGLKDEGQLDGYLTNDRTGGVTVFPLEGELTQLYWHPQYMVSHLESSLRGEESWVKDIRLGTHGSGIVEVIKEKGFEKAHIGVIGVSIKSAGQVEGYVPYGTWSYVTASLPEATFHEMSQQFSQRMAVKSEEEIRLLRRATEIGESACRVMLEVTRPGVSESEIYAQVMAELFRNGANGLLVPYAGPMILHSGPDNPSWGTPVWMARAQKPRIIQKGDLVQAEIFPRYGAIDTQVQMSIAIAPVDPINHECAEIARQSYEAGLKAFRPGRVFGEVTAAMAEPLKAARAWHLTPLVHSLCPLRWGGRMGVGMEELPGIERYTWNGAIASVERGTDLVIRPNTVWELEPNACLGKYRVNIGGTVLITEDGTEELNKLATQMRIID